jgi:hypothetical protein
VWGRLSVLSLVVAGPRVALGGQAGQEVAPQAIRDVDAQSVAERDL